MDCFGGLKIANRHFIGSDADNRAFRSQPRRKRRMTLALTIFVMHCFEVMYFCASHRVVVHDHTTELADRWTRDMSNRSIPTTVEGVLNRSVERNRRK